MDLGSGIRDPGSGKNLFRIPDPGVKKAPDPGFGSATLLLWVIFALLDPVPDSESGSGSTDPIESGFNPDLQPWFLDPGSGMGKNQYPGSGINIRIRNTAYEVHHLSSFNSVTL